MLFPVVLVALVAVARAADPSSTYNADSFVIDGNPVVLRGGSIQWWRLPQSTWRERVTRFKAAGFNTVEMYISWAAHEPEPGVFDWETYDIRGFLDLCKELDVWVYSRPGPYITNELSSGGLPPWIYANATKKSKDADGRPNLRTDDPDYLALVRRYYRELHAVLVPYQRQFGGPIIIGSQENEYSWFVDVFFALDKLFWYEGGPERGLLQDPGVTEYLSALRDYAHEDNFTVPMASCPGDGTVAAMGNTPGIIPMPNYYTYDREEKRAQDVLRGMHDPDQFDGVYVDMPSGTTETFRDSHKFKRFLMAGYDAFFAFNIAGFYQDGFQNALVMNANPAAVIEFTLENVQDAFLSPEVAYFGSATDFVSGISASGLLRDVYFDFRRINIFVGHLEAEIARHGIGHRGENSDDDHVQVRNDALGADEGGLFSGRAHYWLELASGATLFTLVNEGQSSVTVEVGEITVGDQVFPQEAPITVPIWQTPPLSRQFEPQSQTGIEDYAMLLVANLEVAPGLTLAYSTAEVMSWAELADGSVVVVVYGEDGARGEVLVGDTLVVVDYADAGAIHAVPGTDLKIFATTTHQAGRCWWLDAGAGLVCGLSWFDAATMRVEIEDDARPITFVPAVATDTLSLGTVVEQTEAVGGVQQYSKTLGTFSVDENQTMSGMIVREAFDAEAGEWEQEWTGQARSMDDLGYHSSAVIYKGTVTLGDCGSLLGCSNSLYVDHASDIISVYINGNYITTVCPLGTEIDSDSGDASYNMGDLEPFLVDGVNEVVLRVLVPQRGSFMFPRGSLTGTGQLPAVGYDSIKGLWGNGWLDDEQILNWAARPFVYAIPDNPEWTPQDLPVTVASGDGLWYRTSFEWTVSSSEFLAPPVLELKGSNVIVYIYIGDRVIGRWISDEEWISRGTWASAVKDLWTFLDVDHFPLEGYVVEGQELTLDLYVLDMGVAAVGSGVLDSAKILVNRENRVGLGEGQFDLLEMYMAVGELSVVGSDDDDDDEVPGDDDDEVPGDDDDEAPGDDDDEAPGDDDDEAPSDDDDDDQAPDDDDDDNTDDDDDDDETVSPSPSLVPSLLSFLFLLL